MNQIVRQRLPFAGPGMALPPGYNPASPYSSPNPPDVQYNEEFTVYNIVVATIAALGTFNGNIQIQADTDFKWIKAAYMVDLAGAAVTETSLPVPLCNVQLFDSGSGRQ